MKHIVKYTGPEQHTRILLAKDELEKGVVLPGDLEWGPSTRHSLTLDDLDDTALEFFKKDSDFSVHEVKAEDAAGKTPKP